MKTKNIIWLSVGFLMMCVSLHGCSSYTAMTGYDEDVITQWGNVEVAYQRRSDLIPNLVEVVKGSASFEQSTLTAVVEARSNISKIRIDPSNLDADAIAKFQAAQTGLSQALSRLMVVSEQYPELKASKQFSELMAEVSGTENRIAVERRKFNQTVNAYNKYIRKSTQVIWASVFGFERKGVFKSDAGAEKAPKIDMNISGR